jgi:hypothetical protein
MWNAERDRRQVEREFTDVLKRSLNDEQLASLLQLERFGWILKFVRQDAGEPVAAVFDPDHHHYAVLERDGSVRTDPPLQVRR